MDKKTRKPNTAWVLLTLFVIATMLVSCAPQPAATEPPAEVQPTEAPAAAEPEATEPPAEAAPAEPADDGDLSPDIPDPTEPVVVTFASWVHSGGENDIWEILAARFHEIHPNITIEFQDVPFEELHDKLLTQIAAGNPPDAAYVDSPIVGEFAQRDALVNLDEFISKSSVIDVTDYVPGFLTAAQYNGSMYGLPIDGESTGLFYRTDRFEEVGLDPTHPPATWAEFEEYAAKLTDPANKKYGTIVFATEAGYYFYPWLWQANGSVLNPDNPNDVIFDSEAGQKAANFYVNLAKYSPPDFLNSNSWDGRVAFANGDVAMYVAGAWFAGVLLSEFPEATGYWNSAPLPTDERCATTIASDHLVVFSASKNPEAAYKWIEFVSSPENMAVLNLGTPEYPATLLPPRISLLEDPALFEGRDFLQGFADNMKCAVVDTIVQPKFYLVEETLTEYLGRAFYGEFPDGATAIKEAAIAAEAALQE